jgi:hypothetical protein
VLGIREKSKKNRFKSFNPFHPFYQHITTFRNPKSTFRNPIAFLNSMKNYFLGCICLLCNHVATAQPKGITPPVNSTHQSNDASGLNLTAQVADTLHLEQGWNLVGLYVNPTDATLTTMLAPILNQIILMKSVDGRTFMPSKGINTIQTWNIREGYWIKMAQSADVVLNGSLIDPLTFQIPFHIGWQLIPNVRTTATLFSTIFSSHRAQIELAKDHTGQTWIPSLNGNPISKASVNRAYKVKFNAKGVLSQPRATRYFEVSNKATGADATILLTQSVSQEVLQIGDEVGVFNVNGLLCGSVVWNGANTAITVKGDDPLTVPQEGMKTGETYQLRVKRQGFALPIRMNGTFENAGQSQYAADNIAPLTKLTLIEMPTLPFLEQAFAYAAGTELMIRLEGDDDHAQVTLTDAMGNILQSIPEHQNQGKVQIWKFDTTPFADGTYFYTVKTVNKTHNGTYAIQH